MSDWSGFWQKMTNLRWSACDQHVLEVVGDTLGWGPERTLLEIGCGRGMHSHQLHQAGRCGRIDLVDEADEARRLACRLPFARDYEGGWATDALPTHTYDIVWSSGVVEHYFGDERQDIIEDHFRLADEWVVLVVPRQTWTRWLFPPRADVPLCRLYSKDELHKRMARPGWDVTVTTFAPLFGLRHIPDAFYPVLTKLLGLFLPDNLLIGIARKKMT